MFAYLNCFNLINISIKIKGNNPENSLYFMFSFLIKIKTFSFNQNVYLSSIRNYFLIPKKINQTNLKVDLKNYDSCPKVAFFVLTRFFQFFMKC